MKSYTDRHLVLAFLLGVFCVLAGYRWYQLERSAYYSELRLSYIESFLERATGGGR